MFPFGRWAPPNSADCARRDSLTRVLRAEFGGQFRLVFTVLACVVRVCSRRRCLLLAGRVRRSLRFSLSLFSRSRSHPARRPVAVPLSLSLSGRATSGHAIAETTRTHRRQAGEQGVGRAPSDGRTSTCPVRRRCGCRPRAALPQPHRVWTDAEGMTQNNREAMRTQRRLLNSTCGIPCRLSQSAVLSARDRLLDALVHCFDIGSFTRRDDYAESGCSRAGATTGWPSRGEVARSGRS
jgi:hypothetical protein